jgi:hypothetical protein
MIPTALKPTTKVGQAQMKSCPTQTWQSDLDSIRVRYGEAIRERLFRSTLEEPKQYSGLELASSSQDHSCCSEECHMPQTADLSSN